MKKANIIWMLLLTISVLSGCSSTNALLTDKIEAKDIDKLQVKLAMGNPKYGAKSKIITDKDEIRRFVDAFNGAVISDKVKSSNIVVSDTSTYYFYSNDGVTQQFSFNGNDSERIWYKSNWYYINYPDRTPYELYKSSSAHIIIVDENLNELKDTVRKVSSEQVKAIKPEMKYDDIINLLGSTRNVGSGVFVLEYIVDGDKILHISIIDNYTPCGRSGEELLQKAKPIKN